MMSYGQARELIGLVLLVAQVNLFISNRHLDNCACVYQQSQSYRKSYFGKLVSGGIRSLRSLLVVSRHHLQYSHASSYLH